MLNVALDGMANRKLDNKARVRAFITSTF
jgi:hypothetical protein